MMISTMPAMADTDSTGSVYLFEDTALAEESNYTLEAARHILINIFKFQQDDLCEDDSLITNKALSLLLAHPSLAYEEFEASEDLSFRFLPLSIFVASGAPLGVVAILHKLNPDAACSKHPILKLYPLQAACEVHADHDVINFLAFMHPRAVAERDYKGDLIIHSVLGQGVHDIPKRSTIELLLSLNPESLHERSADGACPLGVAFRAKQGPKIIEKIISIRIQQQITSFEIGEWKDYILDAKDVSRLSFELFPKLFLTSLTCAPLAYSEAGFIYLMEYLMQDNRIEELTLSVPPLNEPKAIAFLRFLRLNSTIRQLQLTRNRSQWTLGNGIECILDGLHLNNSIQHLTMAGVFLFSINQLGCLISRAPETLVLDGLLVENKWNRESCKDWGTSKVKSLTICNVKMGGKCLDKLLGAMPTLYALRDLTLDFSVPQDLHDAEFLNGRDVTPQIVALLEKNRIRSLNVKGLHVEIMSLAQALRNNTSLRVLHMDALWNELPMKVQCLVHILENDNRSLEDIKFHCESELLGDDQRSELDEVEDTGIANICQLVEDPALTFYTERNRCQRRQKLLNVSIR